MRLSEAAWAEDRDVVSLSSSSGSGGQIRLRGRVIDYTGTELRFQIDGGSERSYPADRVAKIETRTLPEHVSADAKFDQAEFSEALADYEKARRLETRPWVQRRITARIVWCHRAMGRIEAAGREFVGLVERDPNTPHFGCIPLAWASSHASLTLEQSAQTWFRHEEAAVSLLGASHLFGTRARSQAVSKLKQLANDSNRSVALLALAQTWRAATANVSEAELTRWRATLGKMPDSLRAGPYCVLGQGWWNKRRWEEAALAWLHVPILYAEHRHLAARLLVDAGRALEKLDRPDQAASLYRESITAYGKTPSEPEARQLLREILARESASGKAAGTGDSRGMPAPVEGGG